MRILFRIWIGGVLFALIAGASVPLSAGTYDSDEKMVAIGTCYAARGPDDVIKLCTDMLKKVEMSERPGMAVRITISYLQLGRFADALNVLDAAVDKLPSDKHILELRCWTRAVLSQMLDGALDDCNNAMQMDGENASVFDARGLVYFKKGDFASAISDFTAALQIKPRLVTSLYARGLAKLKVKDDDGGSADIAAAKAIDPEIADQYAGYGIRP